MVMPTPEIAEKQREIAKICKGRGLNPEDEWEEIRAIARDEFIPIEDSMQRWFKSKE